MAEYYAEILATASKKETASKVMVTFIEILNRLTADEIKILEFINSPNNFVTIEDFTENELSTYDIPKDVNNLKLVGSLPVVDVNLHTTGKTGYRTLVRNFNYIREKISLDYPTNLEAYLDNMISLGLLERKFSRTFAIGKIYDCLEKHTEMEKMKKSLGSNQRIELERGRLDITDLGKKLLILCSPKKG